MRHTWVMIVVLMSLPFAGALDPLGLQNDANTGADAPDAAEDAAPLAPGSYTGALTATAVDGADWFAPAYGVGETFRVVFRATSGAVLLRVENAAGVLVHQGYSEGGDVWYRSPASVGFRFAIATYDPSPGAAYAFTLDAGPTPVQNDAGVPGDASGGLVGARPIGEGSFEGLLHAPTGDVSDWYAPSPGDQTTIATLVVGTGGPVTLSLRGPSGDLLRTATTDGPLVAINASGATAIEVATPATAPAATYTLGVAFAPTIPPVPQNDAGIGGDAPDDYGPPLPAISQGDHAGRLEFSNGDENDLFDVLVPDGSFMFIDIVVVEGPHTYFGLYQDGQLLDQTEGNAGHVATIGAGDGRITLSFGNAGLLSGLTIYTFSVRFVETLDVAVTGLRVLVPESGDPFAREIQVDVANLGARTFGNANLKVRVIPSEFAASLLLDAPLALDAGATTTFIVPWDTTTFVGEFTIRAVASWTHDEVPTNNVQQRRASAAVDPGLGEGYGYHFRTLVGL